MSIPFPGTPVRGSTTGKPIMALLDLLGRTWSLGIVWNLADSPTTFSQLQEKCESISPTLLNSRLKELVATQIIIKTVDGYQLTKIGEGLYQLIEPMGHWSKEWQLQLAQKGNNHEQ